VQNGQWTKAKDFLISNMINCCQNSV